MVMRLVVQGRKDCGEVGPTFCRACRFDPWRPGPECCRPSCRGTCVQPQHSGCYRTDGIRTCLPVLAHWPESKRPGVLLFCDRSAAQLRIVSRAMSGLPNNRKGCGLRWLWCG